jgi:hypothetical protein
LITCPPLFASPHPHTPHTGHWGVNQLATSSNTPTSHYQHHVFNGNTLQLSQASCITQNTTSHASTLQPEAAHLSRTMPPNTQPVCSCCTDVMASTAQQAYNGKEEQGRGAGRPMLIRHTAHACVVLLTSTGPPAPNLAVTFRTAMTGPLADNSGVNSFIPSNSITTAMWNNHIH